jgi:DNA topoisomerase-1
MGDIVAERLLESFDNLMDYTFTAKLEEELDKVAEGKLNWKTVLNDFYHDFSGKLKQASGEDGMRRNQPVAIDLPCVLCTRPMQIRTASTGVFLGCSGYALPPKERCKGTINLMPVEHIVFADNDEEGETAELRAKKRCPKCGTAMDSYLVDTERKLHVCGNNPDCDGFLLEQGSYKLKGYEGPVVECDKCGGKMELKSGRFGQYFACSTCPNTRKVLKSGEPAPPKADAVPTEIPCAKSNDHFVLRDGAAGLFLAASQYPKHRETRTPTLAELQSLAAHLDPKFHYLLQAPATDDYGHPSLLRFSRKAKEQYVMTEDEEGKPTGWQAYYREGHWKITKGKLSK